jgi:hypothetical protein
MEQQRNRTIAALQSLIFLGRGEEKRLRAILADAPKFMVKMQARADLEKLVRIAKAQSVELEKLRAEQPLS